MDSFNYLYCGVDFMSSTIELIIAIVIVALLLPFITKITALFTVLIPQTVLNFLLLAVAIKLNSVLK